MWFCPRPSSRLATFALAVAGLVAAGGSPRAHAAALVVVRLETERGAIEITVDAVHAPRTAANFLAYVDAGRYSGGFFHRAVRPGTETNMVAPIEVVQASQASGTPSFPAIALEPTRVTGLKHLNGTVSMARSGPDSATSDFFICIGDQPSLDYGGARNLDGQGFAAFGQVTAGMDVVRAIQQSPVFPGTQTLQPPIAIRRAIRRQ